MKNNTFQSFSFVNIVSLIFLMIVFVGNFMGLLYILEGNFAFAFVGSVLLTILYVFVIKLLVVYKQKMVDNFLKHGSYLLWLFYLGLAGVSMFLLTHFINIEYNVKEDIQESAYQKIAVLDEAMELYSDNTEKGLEDFETEFKIKLQSYKNYGDSDLLDELQDQPYNIESRFLRNREFIEVNQTVGRYMGNIYEKAEKDIRSLDSIVRQNNLKFNAVFSNWKRLSLMDTYSGLNKYIKDSEKLINDKAKSLPFETDVIAIDFDSSILPLNKPFELNKRFKPNYLIPIVVVLIVHIFLILPFIFTPVRRYNRKKLESPKDPSFVKGNNYQKGSEGRVDNDDLNIDF